MLFTVVLKMKYLGIKLIKYYVIYIQKTLMKEIKDVSI